jgi:hypothetical protein
MQFLISFRMHNRELNRKNWQSKKSIMSRDLSVAIAVQENKIKRIGRSI